jgi:BPG-independent PGAM N-terminus (iPGM_N)/Metalloenzyme superfamily
VQAHGTAVGLPTDDDMGNSEVGHNALGSGQVVDQGARLVDIALEDGSMFKSDGWKHIEPAFAEGTLHLIGLCSNGGVHSRLDQARAPPACLPRTDAATRLVFTLRRHGRRHAWRAPGAPALPEEAHAHRDRTQRICLTHAFVFSYIERHLSQLCHR